MGYQFRESCHATEASALQAACSAQYPATWRNSAGELIADSCAVSGSTMVVSTLNTATAASAAMSFSPSFSACDPDVFVADISALWLLGVVLLAVITFAKMAGQPIFSLWRDH